MENNKNILLMEENIEKNEKKEKEKKNEKKSKKDKKTKEKKEKKQKEIKDPNEAKYLNMNEEEKIYQEVDRIIEKLLSDKT